MKTVAEIREDLKDIRYYYSRKKMIDEAFRVVGTSSIVDKVNKYNAAVMKAPARLYDLYHCLYVRGLTQDAFSIELNYTPEFVHVLSVQLINYLQPLID